MRCHRLASILVISMLAFSIFPGTSFAEDNESGIIQGPSSATGSSTTGSSTAGAGTSGTSDNLESDSSDAVISSENSQQVRPDPQHMWDASSYPSLFSSSPYWAANNGVPSFFDGFGSVFASPALKVIDVSSWQGEINWDQVKASGVDGAIIRLGYGLDSLDSRFARNVSEARRVGMPFSVYLYSYADDAQEAVQEAQFVSRTLKEYGITNTEFPIYYDLENWSWTDSAGQVHRAPQSISQYESIVSSFINTMASAGFRDVDIYSYRYYCQSVLNSPSILSRVSWIAEYGSKLQFSNPYYSGQYGWQYSSSQSVPGISGNVDMSAFSATNYLNITKYDSVTIPSGTYYINSHLDDAYGFEVGGTGCASGDLIQLGSYGKADNQRFRFERQSDGSYVIANEQSGLVLDVQGASAYSGAKVQLYQPNGTAAQRWFIRDAGDGYYIQSALGNWALDVSGANVSDGASITLYAPNGSAAQKFMVASACEVSADITYQISSTLNSGLVIDLSAASTANGAAIQLYKSNGSDAQLFSFHEVGNGVYEIVSASSGKLIEIPGGATANGSKVAQYSRNGTLSQHWSLQPHEDGSYTIVSGNSGKCLDVAAGNAYSGLQLQIYDSNGTSAQKWFFDQCETRRQRIDGFAASKRGTIAPGVYAIGSVSAKRQVIDVSAGSQLNGANIQLYESNGSKAQRWSISEDGDGYLTIKNVGSGKVLDVTSASTSDGTNVQQYASNNSYAQKWIASKNPDGSITFYSALDITKALDLYCGNLANGANVEIYSTNGTNAQKFMLYAAHVVIAGDQPIEDGTYLFSAEDSQVLDVPSANISDGVQLQTYRSNGTVAQAFCVEYDETVGLYTIRSLVSSRLLDADQGDIVPGAKVSQWGISNEGQRQRFWTMQKDQDGWLILNAANGLALGSENGRLVTVEPNDSRAIRWDIKSSTWLGLFSDLARTANEQGVVIENGVYEINSNLSVSKKLDVSTGSNSDGANVQLYQRNHTKAQQWKIINSGSGFIKIQNMGSQKYLDVSGGVKKSGTNVWQYSNNDTLAQLWLPVRQADGSYILYSALGNGLVLDVSGGLRVDGANVQIYSVNNTASQQFAFSNL